MSSCYGCYGGYGGAAPRPGATGGGPRVDPNLVPRNEAEADAIRDALKKLRQKKKEENPAPSDTLVSSSPRAARITVNLPADARLYIDNVFCPLTSSTRSFPTPPLRPGREFSYTLRAEVTRDGQTRVQSQRIVVGAGRQVNVEFNNFAPVQTAQR